MSSEVGPCVVWALGVSLPFLVKLIEDQKNNDRRQGGPYTLRKAVWQGRGAAQDISKEVKALARRDIHGVILGNLITAEHRPVVP
jgi:hypothetical protein